MAIAAIFMLVYLYFTMEFAYFLITLVGTAIGAICGGCLRTLKEPSSEETQTISASGGYEN